MRIPFQRFVYNIFFRLSPLLILVLLELSLRFLGIGEDYRSFQRSPDKNRYVLNADFYQRFMAPEQFDTLAFPLQEFPVEKAVGTRRIFLVSDQSLFSLFPQAADKPVLTALQDAGRMQYEFIQLAAPLSNSFAVRRLILDVRRYSPDACVILSGANEFYGLPRKSTWIRDSDNYYGIAAYVFLKNNRFFQMLERFVYLKNPSATQFPPQNIDDWGISRGSRTYTESRSMFRRNLDRITGKNHFPVFVLTVPVNIKQMPYRSDFSDKELSDAEIVRECSILVSNTDRFTLERWIGELEAWEPGSAVSYYCRAMISEREEEYGKAIEHYRRALEEDIFRVRSEPEINADIREICQKNGAILIDAEAVFLKESDEGLNIHKFFRNGTALNDHGQSLFRALIEDSLKVYFEN